MNIKYGIVAIALFMGVLAGCGTDKSVIQQKTTSSKIMSEDFFAKADIKNSEGKSWSEYKAKKLTVLCISSKTWNQAPDALQQMADIVAKKDDVGFVTIAIDGDVSYIPKGIEALTISAEAQKQLRTQVIVFPSTYFIDSEGKMVGNLIGGKMQPSEFDFIVDDRLLKLQQKK